MMILDWALYPIRSLIGELRELRAGNKVKLAYLHSQIENGEIHGEQLDAVTECLEAQSVNIKTKHLNGGGK